MAELVNKDLYPAFKRFICSLCSHLVWNAIQTPCKHLFCSPCIQNWLVENSSCPVDQVAVNQDQLQALSSNDLGLQLLGDQIIYCPHHREKGCDWTGHYSDAHNHLATSCGYEEVHCRNQPCKSVMRRSEQKNHEEKCDFRLIDCEFCQQNFMFNQTKQHVDVDCPDIPVQCPEAECGQTIKRAQLGHHRDQICQKAIIQCPLMKYGCPFECKRENMAAHLNSNDMVLQHILIVCHLVDQEKKDRIQEKRHFDLLLEEEKVHRDRIEQQLEREKRERTRLEQLIENEKKARNEVRSKMEQLMELKKKREENQQATDSYKKELLTVQQALELEKKQRLEDRAVLQQLIEQEKKKEQNRANRHLHPVPSPALARDLKPELWLHPPVLPVHLLHPR